ncbi:MAG: DUF1501 domain-containing protein [Planctomycetota bacterium]|nr:DUF1501 domain-containing protein [Planctomycetota bacterium]
MMAESDRKSTRRRLLKLASGGGLGLTLGGLLRAQAGLAAEGDSAQRFQPAIKSCIVVFYYGGPSHLDTYDMKPDGPAEIRGEFRPIDSAVPGLQVSEHLPQMARVMDRCAVVRSMHHTNRLHDSASTESLTGRQSPVGDREEFAPIPQFFPSYGAVVSHAQRGRSLEIPHAALPWVFHNVVDTPCQGGGFLGKAYNPFQIIGDPSSSSYGNPALRRLSGMTRARMVDRRLLLERMETGGARLASASMQELRLFYEKAYQLIDSPLVARVLDIEREPMQVRERYGLVAEEKQAGGNGAERAYGRNLRGQNLLLARRLVEAGVPFVNVYDYRQQGQNWDSHADNFVQHKKYLLPAADRSLSALIEDLEERGLLDSTLVVAMGEFGRTPTINGNAGRDHWPDCYSILLAGGGVKGGYVYGASDQRGAYPIEDAVTPADLAATIYWRFGIDPAGEMHDMTGRPWRLADGQPIRNLFGDV